MTFRPGIRRAMGRDTVSVLARTTCLMVCAGVALQCDRVATGKPQLLVFVDTDLPSVGQSSERPDLSFDAAIDSVRIDAVGFADGQRTFVVPAVESWPFSFGVTPPANGHSVRLRIRGFKSTLTNPLDPTAPQAQVSIDRIVDVAIPDEGISAVRVILRGDCMGIAPAFTDPPTTCVDGTNLHGQPDQGLITGLGATLPSTLLGTWAPAIEAPCDGDPPEGAVCIKGGFTILGEDNIRGVSDGALYRLDPNPVRPVVLKPFFLDVEEFTVARLRQVMAENPGEIDPKYLPIQNSVLPGCNFESLTDATFDKYPVNCMGNEPIMRKLCQLSGGDLATEAQWEHAARGRGQHRPYAWGNETPDCVHANLAGCGNQSISLDGSGTIATLDMSRDGVHNLTGNLRELTLDRQASYDSSCWNHPGVVTNPECDDQSIPNQTIRGGGFTTEQDSANLAMRGAGSAPTSFGLRCAYSDVEKK